MNKEQIITVFRHLGQHILKSFIPNKRDNLKSIAVKVTFLVSLITLIVSSLYLANYFLNNRRHDIILNKVRNIRNVSDPADGQNNKDWMEQLLTENPDFKGWVTISETEINHPVYQTEDNDFYLNHNQLKKRDIHGAVFFDYNNVISKQYADKNLVLYGHHMKNGSMFGTLPRLKSLPFYKQNPTIDFTTLYDSGTYKIYSIFILNASKKDDNGYIYNISRKNFLDKDDFNAWTAEAFERSLIKTHVDVELGDDIITLVTCVNDFENARLVVMARKTRELESSVADTSGASVNPSPRYPKRWYDDRNKSYPY